MHCRSPNNNLRTFVNSFGSVDLHAFSSSPHPAPPRWKMLCLLFSWDIIIIKNILMKKKTVMMMTFVSCNHISNLCLICHNGGWEKNNKSEHKILHCHVKKYCTAMWTNIVLPCEEMLHSQVRKYYNKKTLQDLFPCHSFWKGLLWMLRVMFWEM